MYTLIILALTNTVAELHLHSLHRSREINNNNNNNNNVFKLLLDLQAVHCRSAAALETVKK
jgi:hypothetical protein